MGSMGTHGADDRGRGRPAVTVALLALVGACSIGTAGATATALAGTPRAATPQGAVLTPAPVAHAEDCHLDGNQVTTAADTREAPVVVLYELRVGPGGRRTLAAWADGAIVFGEDPHRQEARVSPAAVERLRARLATRLTARWPSAALGQIDRVTGERRVSAHDRQVWLLVRDGQTWRITVLWGLDDREQVLAAAPSPPSRFLRERPPAWFVAAYRDVVTATPTAGAPWAPDDYAVRLYTDPPRAPGDGFPQDYGAPLPWPRDLPAPPATQSPEACDLTLQATTAVAPCRFRVGSAHRAAVAALLPSLHDGRHVRPVVYRGQPWFLSFKPMFRGEVEIHDLQSCIEEHIPTSWSAPQPPP